MNSIDFMDNLVALYPVLKNSINIYNKWLLFYKDNELQKIYDYGGFVEIHTLPSSKAGFPFGFPSAVYFLKRGYKGETKIKMLDGISFKARK